MRKNYSVSFQEELKYHEFVAEGFWGFFVQLFPPAFSYSFEQATTHKLPQYEYSSNITEPQKFKCSFLLYCSGFYMNACLIWFQTIKLLVFQCFQTFLAKTKAMLCFLCQENRLFLSAKVQIPFLQLSLKWLHAKTHDSCLSSNLGAEHPRCCSLDPCKASSSVSQCKRLTCYSCSFLPLAASDFSSPLWNK